MRCQHIAVVSTTLSSPNIGVGSAIAYTPLNSKRMSAKVWPPLPLVYVRRQRLSLTCYEFRPSDVSIRTANIVIGGHSGGTRPGSISVHAAR